MNKLAWLSLVSVLALPACGSSSDGGNGTTSSEASGSSKGDTSTTGATEGTGGNSGTAGTGGGATGGGTSTGGNDAGDAVTIVMDEFTVAPGAEVYKCQNFANPFGGDGNVGTFESHMTAGSHHLLLFYKAGATDDALEDCSGLEFAATPYSTQQPDDSLTLPDGVAALIPSSYGVRLQAHYLNTSAAPVQAQVKVTFHTRKPEDVTAYSGVLFVIEPKINIPAHSTGDVKHDCSLPMDMNLIKASSHMHKHGTHFTSTIAGETIVDTDQWSDPKPVLYDPVKPVKSGDALSFTCSYNNDGDVPLTFGESAQTNEMCIFVSAFYPVTSPSQVTVDCQK